MKTISCFMFSLFVFLIYFSAILYMSYIIYFLTAEITQSYSIMSNKQPYEGISGFSSVVNTFVYLPYVLYL